MKGYEKYKISTFQWFDKIPEHWIEGKIKYFFEISRGRVISQLELKAEAKFPVYSSQTKNDGCLGYIDTFDYEGEMLTWTTDGANAGSVFQRKGQFNCTNVCGILTPTKELELRYYFYYVDFIAQFYKRPDTNGAKIMSNEMAEIHCFIPSLEEQTKIAAFLDYKTNLIDATIEKKKRLIELLKEKRQAVINEAVTKGLNPNAPMKDSGVEWLGEIPDNWEVKKVKYLLSSENGIKIGPFGSALKLDSLTDKGIKIYGQGNVIKDDFTLGHRYIDPERFEKDFKQYEILDGDILITMMGTTGKSKVFNSSYEKGILDSHLLRLRFNEDLFDGRLFSILLEQSDYVFQQLALNSVGSIMAGLNSSIVKELSIVTPKLEIQKEILNYIDDNCKIIDTISSKILSQIEKLQTYRQSLISEAVTGKIDVREWQITNN